MLPASDLRLDVDFRDALLRAALDSIPGETFIINMKGCVLAANTAGHRSLQKDPEDVARRIRRSLRPRPMTTPSSFSLTRLYDARGRTHFLAVAGRSPRESSALAPEAQRRWSLTPRQTQVLELLAHGLTNRNIGLRLGCAERTVELHVSALLERIGAESRAELVARFWRELG